jgi:hypothetical protein
MTAYYHAITSTNIDFRLHCFGVFVPRIDGSRCGCSSSSSFRSPIDTVVSSYKIASAKDETKWSISRDALTIIVSRALRRAYQDVRHAAKNLAASLKTKPTTARAYLVGRRAPCAWNLLQMMAINRELRADINKLVDVLGAAHRAVLNDTGKTNQSSITRKHDAHDRIGVVAQSRVGFGQDWGHDSCILWNTVVLVDVFPIIRRVGCQSDGAGAGQECPDGGKTPDQS